VNRTWLRVNNNWLSDLGNRNLNPNGDFYVWGCIAAGIILGGFFLALTPWRTTGSRIQNWLLLAVQFRVGWMSATWNRVQSLERKMAGGPG
jgi:hypothetical membrane protein